MKTSAGGHPTNPHCLPGGGREIPTHPVPSATGRDTSHSPGSSSLASGSARDAGAAPGSLPAPQLCASLSWNTQSTRIHLGTTSLPGRGASPPAVWSPERRSRGLEPLSWSGVGTGSWGLINDPALIDSHAVRTGLGFLLLPS